MIKEVQVFQGYSTILLQLWDLGNGTWEVSATRFYRTYHGARVEGSHTWTFQDLEAARTKANGYYFWLRERGWKPVPKKRK